MVAEGPTRIDNSLPELDSSPARTAVLEPAATTPGQSAAIRVPQLAALAVLAAYLMLSTLYNFAVPVGEAPDEPSHVDFVQVLLKTGQLPTIPRDSIRFSYEAEQPPLYYFIEAAWMAALWPNTSLLPHLEANPNFSFARETPYNAYLHSYPAQDDVPVHLMRFFSTLIGLCTLILVWLAARVAWPSEPWPPLMALGFAALLPGFTFTSGTVTNDALAALAGAAILFALLRTLVRGLDWPIAAISGTLLGLGILSKRSLLVFLPLLVLAFVLAPSKGRSTRWLNLGIGVLATAVVGIWPFVNNLILYGDPFATAATRLVKGDIASPLAGVPFFWLDRGYIGGLLDSLWGVFGLRNMELPGSVYIVYYLLTLSGVLLSILYVRHATGVEKRVLFLVFATLLLVYAGVAYQNTQFWAVQGRLLLPGLAALSLIVGRGLSTFFALAFSRPRQRRVAVAAILVLLAALNMYALAGRLIPGYYR